MPVTTNKWDTADENGLSETGEIFRGPPTEDEKKSINLVLKACKNEIKGLRYPTDDVVGEWRVLRFVRNVLGDTDKAKKNFKLYLQHRMELNHLIEELGHEVRGMSREEFVQWCEERHDLHFPMHSYAGENENGSVVYFYTWTGGFNYEAMCSSIDSVEVMMDRTCMIIQHHEWLFWYLNERCKKLNEMCYMRKICDLTGLSVNPFKYTGMLSLKTNTSNLMANDYCDGDDSYVMMNAPWIFDVIYPLMKLFLTPRQKKKMIMIEQDDLPKYVRPSCIPRAVGGAGCRSDEIYKNYTDSEAAANLQKIKKLRSIWKGKIPSKVEDFEIYL